MGENTKNTTCQSVDVAHIVHFLLNGPPNQSFNQLGLINQVFKWPQL